MVSMVIAFFPGGGRGGQWKANKTKQGEGSPSMCVRSLL